MNGLSSAHRNPSSLKGAGRFWAFSHEPRHLCWASGPNVANFAPFRHSMYHPFSPPCPWGSLITTSQADPSRPPQGKPHALGFTSVADTSRPSAKLA